MGNSCMAAVDARDAQRSAATRRRTARVMTAASAVAEVTHAASIGEENVLFEGALFPRRWRYQGATTRHSLPRVSGYDGIEQARENDRGLRPWHPRR